MTNMLVTLLSLAFSRLIIHIVVRDSVLEQWKESLIFCLTYNLNDEVELSPFW